MRYIYTDSSTDLPGTNQKINGKRSIFSRAKHANSSSNGGVGVGSGRGFAGLGRCKTIFTRHRFRGEYKVSLLRSVARCCSKHDESTSVDIVERHGGNAFIVRFQYNTAYCQCYLHLRGLRNVALPQVFQQNSAITIHSLTLLHIHCHCYIFAVSIRHHCLLLLSLCCVCFIFAF